MRATRSLLSALALLVPGVGADHHDPAVAADHLAVFTDRLDAGADFHDRLLASGVGHFEGAPGTAPERVGADESG